MFSMASARSWMYVSCVCVCVCVCVRNKELEQDYSPLPPSLAHLLLNKLHLLVSVHGVHVYTDTSVPTIYLTTKQHRAT